MPNHPADPRHVRLPYRADVDGLRAVAVLAVIGFHAFPAWVPGGFVGVDMFFALSGFLITSIILAGIERGRFDVADFYARRIKRIFPALLVVITSTYVFGCYVLFDDELKQLGRHVAGGAGFVSNLVLWSEDGYFDFASETKPLLHLWSLGIEEQFYLVWPWVVMGCAHRRLPLLVVTSALLLVSLFIGMHVTDTNPTAAFFAPYTRIWELFGGALLAGWQRRQPAAAGPRWTWLATLAMALGIALVTASLWLFTAFDVYPGWRAALPVLGTLLLIYAGPNAWLNRAVLSSAPLRWLGVLSYPLYLWHWPLLAYGRVLGHRALPPAYAAGAMVLALALAWLTYQCLEKPIRFRWRGRLPVAVLLIALTVTAMMGLATPLLLGVSDRAVSAASRDNQGELEWVADYSADCVAAWGITPTFCLEYGKRGAPQVMLLGDSSANAMAPGLGEAVAALGAGMLHVGSFGCPPIRGLIERAGWYHDKHCIEAVERAYDIAAHSASVETVVLVMMARGIDYWGVPHVAEKAPLATRFDAMAPLLLRDIKTLVTAGKRVVISYDMPSAPMPARDCLPRPFAAPLSGGYDACRPPANKLFGREPYVQMFDQLLSGLPQVCIFRQSALLLPDERLNMFDRQGRLLMRDDHHLSLNGSRQMARLLLSQCGQLTATR